MRNNNRSGLHDSHQSQWYKFRCLTGINLNYLGTWVRTSSMKRDFRLWRAHLVSTSGCVSLVCKLFTWVRFLLSAPLCELLTKSTWWRHGLISCSHTHINPMPLKFLVTYTLYIINALLLQLPHGCCLPELVCVSLFYIVHLNLNRAPRSVKGVQLCWLVPQANKSTDRHTPWATE